MASMIDHDLNDSDEEQRHMQIESVLDGDEDDHLHDDNSDDYGDDDSSGQKMDYSNERTMFKMLISDNAAGAIIGKSGKTIADLQAQSNARLKLSQASEFYPGTNDRTIILTGPLQTVIDAQDLIWDKTAQFSKPRGSHRAPPKYTDDSNTSVVGKILIPSDAGGLIIGRSGTTIKAIQEESGTRVQISPKDDIETKMTKERVLTISGSLDGCSKCTELIIMKLQEDPNIAYQNKTTSYGRSFGLRGDDMQPHHMRQAMNQMNLPMGAETVSAVSTITINVPDSIVGFVLGKRGSVITEIQQLSGAKVVVSPRKPRDSVDEVATEDSSMRIVTITGPPTAAQMAQFLITQKLQLAKADSDGAHHHR